MHELAVVGPDVADQLTRLCLNTADDADDVLARRWHAEAILTLMGRRHAVDVWSRLESGEHVELEDALGAYDDFVLGRIPGVGRISSSLDALAAAIREGRSGFDNLTIRQKAVAIAQHLRSEGVVGMSNLEDYHALRNNFISPGLEASDRDQRGCLPLQSVTIYCAVARRLNIHARPSNFPRHVHAIITAPADMTLDGKLRVEGDNADFEPEMMHMDPFRQHEEIAEGDLLAQLSRIGVPPDQYAAFLGPASELEMVLRSARNILVSVDGQHMPGEDLAAAEDEPQTPDPAIAKYGALWSLFIHGDTDHDVATGRRRQAIQYLLEKFQADFSHDVDMFAETAPRLLVGLPELPLVMALTQGMIAAGRAPKTPVARPDDEADPVQYRIGTYFEHQRYRYRGFIVGWNPTCSATSSWISQMRVDELPRGRRQPFYNIIAADKSSRYVAEENIAPLQDRPPESLMRLAGRYFKRWDQESGRFISNMRDEYPDD
ncbi:unnamed protein product [Discula destructiva]